jgi:C1A family cysteine protease
MSKHELVVVPDKHDQRDLIMNRHLDYTRNGRPLPRHSDLRPHMPKIQNQGQTGSCTGHAIAACMEYDMMAHHQQELDLSRLFIYYNERWSEGTQRSDAGGEIRDGIKTIAKYGACEEIVWPFNPTHLRHKPSEEAYAAAVRHRAVLYERVPQTEEAIAYVLGVERRPIVMGIYVYESFESDETAKTGKIPMPDVKNEKCVGGHAVVLAGHDLDQGDGILRNSWGEEWGMKGYGDIPMAYVLNRRLTSDLWTVRKLTT